MSKQRAYHNLTALELSQVQRALRGIQDHIFQLDGRLTSLTPVAAVAGASAIVSGSLIQGMHATRLTSYNPADFTGYLYYETDRTVFYISNGLVWSYCGGTHHCTLAARPTDLGEFDNGFLMHTTTYDHVHQWNWSAGTGSWGWGPGNEVSGGVQMFAVAPTGNGWVKCDGVTDPITYEKSDCTTATIAMADKRGSYPKFANAYNNTVQAAVAPTLGGNVDNQSAGTPTGTNSAPTFTGSAGTTSSDSAGTPSGTNSAPTFTGSGGTTSSPSGTVNGASGADFAAGTGVHTHTFTPAGTVSAPVFTGSALGNHSHTFTPSGTVSAPTFTGDALGNHNHGVTGITVDMTSAEMSRTELIPYFRQ